MGVPLTVGTCESAIYVVVNKASCMITHNNNK